MHVRFEVEGAALDNENQELETTLDFVQAISQRPYELPAYDPIDISPQFVDDTPQAARQAGTPIERAQEDLAVIHDQLETEGINHSDLATMIQRLQKQHGKAINPVDANEAKCLKIAKAYIASMVLQPYPHANIKRFKIFTYPCGPTI